jgi:hypothetical protein
MAHHRLTLDDAAHDERPRPSQHAVLSWIMVLLVMLVASLGFTLDHIVRIAP